MVGQMVCAQCGNVGYPKKITKGSFLIEVVLWLCFIFPGIIYSLWRISSRYSACPSCKAPHMVALDSPIGRKLLMSEGGER
jgi:hypothetical protein